MISRRMFVGLSAAGLLASRLSWAADEVPDALDHILLGCNDLERGIDFVEQHTGVRAAFGGVHPGRGTQNALLSLGKLHYLEIIAPDPKQSEVRQFAIIKELKEPAFIGWAAHVTDMDALAARLQAAHVPFDGPRDGSRARPDGRMLKWKALGLADYHGLVPFFIEWSADSVHPSVDAPAGCRLESFSAVDTNPEALRKIYDSIGIKVRVERGDKPQLRAIIAGPKGKLGGPLPDRR